jgi:hypothetical protein
VLTPAAAATVSLGCASCMHGTNMQAAARVTLASLVQAMQACAFQLYCDLLRTACPLLQYIGDYTEVSLYTYSQYSRNASGDVNAWKTVSCTDSSISKSVCETPREAFACPASPPPTPPPPPRTDSLCRCMEACLDAVRLPQWPGGAGSLGRQPGQTQAVTRLLPALGRSSELGRALACGRGSKQAPQQLRAHLAAVLQASH